MKLVAVQVAWIGILPCITPVLRVTQLIEERTPPEAIKSIFKL